MVYCRYLQADEGKEIYGEITESCIMVCSVGTGEWGEIGEEDLDVRLQCSILKDLQYCPRERGN